MNHVFALLGSFFFFYLCTLLYVVLHLQGLYIVFENVTVKALRSSFFNIVLNSQYSNFCFDWPLCIFDVWGISISFLIFLIYEHCSFNLLNFFYINQSVMLIFFFNVLDAHILTLYTSSVMVESLILFTFSICSNIPRWSSPWRC